MIAFELDMLYDVTNDDEISYILQFQISFIYRSLIILNMTIEKLKSIDERQIHRKSNNNTYFLNNI